MALVSSMNYIGEKSDWMSDIMKKFPYNYIIGVESASEFHCLSNISGHRFIRLYVNKKKIAATKRFFKNHYPEVTLYVEAFDKRRNYRTEINLGVRVLTPKEALVDLLWKHYLLDVDVQVVLEAISNTYYSHGESLEFLTDYIDETIKDSEQKEHLLWALSDVEEDAIDYYNC